MGGVEMGGGDSTVTEEGKQKPMTDIDTSLSPDFRDSKESNNLFCVLLVTSSLRGA